MKGVKKENYTYLIHKIKIVQESSGDLKIRLRI